MELTLQQAYQRATSTNSLYSRQQKRWQFLLDSYNGGEIQNRLTVQHGVIRSDIWPLVEFPVRS